MSSYYFKLNRLDCLVDIINNYGRSIVNYIETGIGKFTLDIEANDFLKEDLYYENITFEELDLALNKILSLCNKYL